VGELVLIVDDDERNAKLARDVLEQAGMRTITATTAEAAITEARAHRPDVVLMDLRLPDLDGAEAARRLAGDPATAAIPVVALSAIPSGDWPADSAFAGYLEKPIDVLSFPGAVRHHCRS
jgi:two-component system cell cycle response regulator DivK